MRISIRDLFTNVYNDTWWDWTIVPNKFKYKRTIYHMTDDDGAFTGYVDEKGRNFLDKIEVRDCLDGYIEILDAQRVIYRKEIESNENSNK